MFGWGSGRRLCGGLGAAVAAVAALSAVPAAALEVDTTRAAPAARMEAFEPDDFADRAARLPAGLTEAIRRDLGVSPEEYLATAAAARLAGEVVASLGDVVRSAWLDGQTLHVAVTDRGAAVAARSTGAQVQVGDVLSDALSAARAQDKLAYIDRAAERVVAVAAEVRGAPAESAAPSGSGEDRDHRGGEAVAVGAGHLCSSAFTGTDDDGDPRLLTAGHCATGPVDPALGELVPDSVAFGDERDAALIAVDGDVLPEVAGDPALPVHDSIDAVAGAPVCAAGVASGWTCGRILDARTTVPVSGQPVTGFLFDACVLPGDGGGAITAGTSALGLSSGSTWTGPSCADGDPAARGDDVSVGFPLTAVEAAYGDDFDLAVRVGAPEVTTPAADAATGPAPTIAGTADAAAGAVVTIRIEDGTELSAAVGPAGRWSVPVGSALEPGVYAYTATTSLEPTSGDPAVTSAETEGEFEVAEQAGLGVTWPAPGHVSPDGRLAFEGTGQPGADVVLTVGGAELARTTVGADGTWSLRAGSERPAGRFDAVLTQHVAETFAATTGTDAADTATATSESGDATVTVANVGVAPGAPVVSAPLGRIEPADAAVLRGAGAPGATVAVRVAASDADVAAAPELRTEAAGDGSWSVRLDAPLAAGRHVVVATQSVDDLTSEPSAPVVVDVAAPARADGGPVAVEPAAEDGGLPGGALAGAAGILVAGAAAAASIVWRRRRTAG
ncbi:S1 family peptidase [Jiangella anatolica]|uniref:Bacterial Ig-like domain-containing protein n=1 Tax=Jiangella anatolica TaxID=2670374 RepID=A0A2W2BT77_9ACTN|nr:S1 family peptidase [Jiangella anatolica]PZF79349.1 hypothetical protein C1I92_31650 [Jiangella anatolica]